MKCKFTSRGRLVHVLTLALLSGTAIRAQDPIGETQSYGFGFWGLGMQLNVDDQGVKDFRFGLDDGLTLGAGVVGSTNVQIGGIYVFH